MNEWTWEGTIREAYKSAMTAGILPTVFWESTLREVQDMIDGIYRAEKEELKVSASMNYSLAILIGHAVQCCFSKGSKMPEIHEVYPNLFEAPKQQDWRITKERMLRYANAHNEKRRKKRDD